VATSVIVPPTRLPLRGRRIFQDSPRCPDDLRGQVNLCAVGIIVNVTPFEPEWEGFVTLGSRTHAAAARILREWRSMPDTVFPVRRDVRGQLSGPQGQVSEATGIVLPKHNSGGRLPQIANDREGRPTNAGC